MVIDSSKALNIYKDASPATKVTRTYRVGRGNGLCPNLIDSGKTGGKFPVSAVAAREAES